MQGRKMVMTASLGIFFGVLFWGMQITLYHLNSLLPPAQSVRAYHLEKLDEGIYRVELLGEDFKVKLPEGEKVIEKTERYMQGINIKKMSGFCENSLEAAKEQGEKVLARLSIQWENLKRTLGIYMNLFIRNQGDAIM
ncbi:hypothetical protein [Desulfolucanica intricata]|uniref:hypothetical protein n=1 Tax=Desulfolucanica intricata TaxID=1285191 RepID=UPI00082BC903|nr:hypothetical protein [Desulfolucanica intricata]